MHRLIVSTFALLAFMGPAAHAEEATMRVSVYDLNLNAEPGAQIALRRIKSSSVAFCGGAVIRPVGSALAKAACSKTMTAKAVALLDAPLVTALHSPENRESAAKLAQR